MKNVDPDSPAFPCNSPDGTEAYSGITLRQYYAAMAMKGLIAYGGRYPDSDTLARYAFDAADAMIKYENRV